MPVSQELMSAILAMDSYNRDYHAGYTIDAVKLGSYSAPDSRQLVGDAQYNTWADAGFFAAAYRNDVGETVISYRGTLWNDHTGEAADILHLTNARMSALFRQWSAKGRTFAIPP